MKWYIFQSYSNRDLIIRSIDVIKQTLSIEWQLNYGTVPLYKYLLYKINKEVYVRETIKTVSLLHRKHTQGLANNWQLQG